MKTKISALPPTSRRSFLKDTALAAGLLALPGGALSAQAASIGKNTLRLETELPVKLDADVLVVGGGPSGLCAAVAAARNGAKTVLIEQAGCAGGMATTGLVGPFMTCYNKSQDKMIIKGLFQEVVERLVKRNGAIHPSLVDAPSGFSSWITIGHKHLTPFDPEKLKLVADEMLRDAGVTVLFHTAFAKTLKTNGSLSGIVINSKNGLEAIRAKIIIDCTGDGDVAAGAGADFELGDPARKIIQPATLFFRIGNVNDAALDADIEKNKANFYRKDGVNYRSFHWWVSKAKEAGDWDLKRVSIGLFRGNDAGQWSVNTSRLMGVNATDAASLTKAEIDGRQQVEQIFRFIKKYLPGCQNAIMLSTAQTVGVRETRHISGDYKMTTDDLLTCKTPADSILLASNSIDVHGRFGPLSNQFTEIEGGEYYGIPYRCLLPAGLNNILMAGRCISATSEAAGAIRLMPLCMGTGQAAGTAAALSINNGNTQPRAVDMTKLRATLQTQGAFLG
ncbi:MAG: FAD-dependent oxidoreductase [Opitutaceae bacterium]|jgi:hypothetical protein|nr:FAD-dependent oxidoreductase [Opitutaceae bacterium]